MSKELEDMSTQFRNSVIEAGRRERGECRMTHLLKRGLQISHVIIGLVFLCLALFEFIRDPPYFDAIGHKNSSMIPHTTFFNITRDQSGGTRRIMDLPILFLYLAYFVVLIWNKGWGIWSLLMTFSMAIMLFVFLIVNYWAINVFDWRFFTPRAYGVLMQVFCFALGWDCVATAVFVKVDWYPFSITTNKPRKLWKQTLLVIWNFVFILIFLFFCLLIWFSRLYYSWACIESLDDVLLMCQFTDFVQCYSCEEAKTCTHLDLCISTVTKTFHCQSPIALLHDVNEALCIFNYNIGFFTFIMVFAYVGGTYFFFLGVLNFTARTLKILATMLLKFMGRKTQPHVKRFYEYSVNRKWQKQREAEEDELEEEEEEDEEEEERKDLLDNMSNDNIVEDTPVHVT